MRKGQSEGIIILLFGLVFLFGLLMGAIIGYNNQQIKYELTQQANGESIWQEKK